MTTDRRSEVVRQRGSLPPMLDSSPAAGSFPGSSGEMELINRLRSGDEHAFEEVVRAHSGRLMSVARRFMRNDEDARDVLQEAFISMHRAIHTFESGARLST